MPRLSKEWALLLLDPLAGHQTSVLMILNKGNFILWCPGAKEEVRRCDPPSAWQEAAGRAVSLLV